jgi:hypothetical protein
MLPTRLTFRPGRTLFATIAFFVGFSVLLGIVGNVFLIPAIIAAQDASPAEKRQLVAFSRLLLAIVLLVLCIGVILLVRVRRFFFPGPQAPRQKTQYIDAWAEAGKRAAAPTPDDDEQD